MTKNSLSLRLALMFAGCGAVLFLVGGLLLQNTLRVALERQVREELSLRATVLESIVGKAATAEYWSGTLAPKIDTLAGENSGTRVWMRSDSERFRYGDDAPGLAALSRSDGFGKLEVAGYDCELVTLVRSVPAQGERPPIKLVLARDPTLFLQTLASFGIALLAGGAAAVALVAAFGFWIARLGLRPLERLSKQAQALRPERREQRLSLQPMPAELSDLSASFNGALDRLERAYKQLEAFNADVAHELRTPLMNLIGQTQVVLTRPRTVGELQETLQSNLEELERLRAIVVDMLFLARADQGASARDYRHVSLAAEVHKVVEFFEPLLDDSGVRINVRGDEHGHIETALFRRAVTNLVQNAIEHSSAGEEIVVQIGREHGSACVSVSNPGFAIETHQLDHLFDRFYRADSSRRNSSDNHGLGLAIVKAIAAMHRGSVFARSEQGWNTFGFTVAAPK